MLAGNTAYSPSAFVSIATVTAAGGESTLSFTSIPQTYKHLQIRGLGKSLSPYGISGDIIRFNSDSGANYTKHYFYGNGSSVGSTGSASQTSAQTDGYSVGTSGSTYTNYYGAIILDIIDYSSTTKYKTLRSQAGFDVNTLAFTGDVYIMSNLWLNTAAITSITMSDSSGLLYGAGATFALYGIAS
jgi:hypothetical protein